MIAHILPCDVEASTLALLVYLLAHPSALWSSIAALVRRI